MFGAGSRQGERGSFPFEIHGKLHSHKMTTHCPPAATEGGEQVRRRIHVIAALGGALGYEMWTQTEV